MQICNSKEYKKKYQKSATLYLNSYIETLLCSGEYDNGDMVEEILCQIDSDTAKFAKWIKINTIGWADMLVDAGFLTIDADDITAMEKSNLVVEVWEKIMEREFYGLYDWLVEDITEIVESYEHHNGISQAEEEFADYLALKADNLKQ
tara:strand:+ start:3561 stop:4004 length:444 start_codon:yes stop_codon:yes gene_type:complete